MAGHKFDGVIEAVRYAPPGTIQTVRVYERRGAIFSDRLLLSRQALVDQLKSGKVFMAGQRMESLAGTFEVSKRVRLVKQDGKDVILSDGQAADHDQLQGVPLF